MAGKNTMTTKKKNTKIEWEQVRPFVDVAIRRGQSCIDFCTENDIKRDDWYSMKPKGFKWHTIQKELNIHVKKPRPAPPHHEENYCNRQECSNEKLKGGSLCANCKIELLVGIMVVYRLGFSDKDITEVLRY